MKYYRISLTITTYASASHPYFHCYLFCDANGDCGSQLIDIDEANQLMWKLKKKGWETVTTTSYHPYNSHIYVREITWLHLA